MLLNSSECDCAPDPGPEFDSLLPHIGRVDAHGTRYTQQATNLCPGADIRSQSLAGEPSISARPRFGYPVHISFSVSIHPTLACPAGASFNNFQAHLALMIHSCDVLLNSSRSRSHRLLAIHDLRQEVAAPSPPSPLAHRPHHRSACVCVCVHDDEPDKDGWFNLLPIGMR